MRVLPILPVLVPLAAAVAQIALLNASQLTRCLLNVLSSVALFFTGLWLFGSVWTHGLHILRIGDWPAPSGVVFVADLLSASLILATGFLATCVSIYCCAEIPCRSGRLGYFAAFQTLLAGVCGAFLTGDLFNLFVWFEVMLVSSFVLMAFEGRRVQLEGALKYTVLNLIASMLFLAAVGVIHGETGTLNMADLARRISMRSESSFALNSGFALLLIAFGAKAGVFPLFFWMPASYHTPAFATSALFAGLLTKVGVYALIRMLTLIFPREAARSQELLLGVAGLTMLVGVLGAAAQYEMRRLLSFHSISQIGYIMMGVAIGTPAALAASLLFLVHHMLVKSNLFLVSGLIARRQGTAHLKKTGGLYKDSALLAALFLLPALSLAGLPPFSGFFAKLSVVRAGLWAEQYVLVAVALVVGFFTLYSMLKIWNEAFWKPAPDVVSREVGQPLTPSLLIPSVLLAAIMIAIGLWPEPWLVAANRIAVEIGRPQIYIQAVLGGM